MNISVSERKPTVAEFNSLREVAQWPTMPPELVSIAISNTLYAVVAETSEGKLIGMARVIGDGAIYFHVQDVIVHPEFQKMGVGRLMMNRVMDFLSNKGGPNTNIGLMCSKGRERFYKTFGFIERPNEKFGAGMIMIKK